MAEREVQSHSLILQLDFSSKFFLKYILRLGNLR